MSTSELSDAHEHAAQLIPWLVNGTLSGEESAWLRAHLAACATCRADLEAEKRLYEAIRNEGPLVITGETSFQKLVARIEADDFAAPEAPAAERQGRAQAAEHMDRTGRSPHRGAARRRSARRPFWHSPAAARWLAAAVAVEALGLGLGVWMWQGRGASDRSADASAYASAFSSAGPSAAPYRTLTSPESRYAAGPRVRVVFRAGLSLERLQQLLQSVGAHIVDGPTEAHVYTLGFAEVPSSGRALDARIAALHADPDVLFAEPAGDRPP